MQLLRARLLGRAVRVDASTFPDLPQIVEDVRTTLQYRGRVEVYVIDAATPSIVMKSLLGTRLILIEGDLVADLMEPGRRAQLPFLLGRSFGALRAKQQRMDLLIQILAAANVLRCVSPFIQPYYRATAYSGDQIGMMCCADLAASLEATRRLLVGREMASQLRAGAVLPQAQLVSRRLLPRLAQLLSSEPHVTNRYANLLCFGRYHDPELSRPLRASIDEREADSLDAIWRARHTAAASLDLVGAEARPATGVRYRSPATAGPASASLGLDNRDRAPPLSCAFISSTSPIASCAPANGAIAM